MKLSAAIQKNYPRCTHYIRRVLPQVGQSNTIVGAMKKCAQLSASQFRRALAWGTWPELRVVALGGPYGAFNASSDPNVIMIAPFVMSRHEAGTDGVRLAKGTVVPILGATILHEMVHWGDAKDKADRAGEEGEEFERLVYGEVTYL